MQQQLIPILTLEQFEEVVRKIVRAEVAHAQQPAPTAPTLVDELLTVPQAAEALCVCKATIFEWLRRGLLISTKIGKRTYLKRADLLTAGTREQRTVKPARVKGKPPN